MLSASRSQISTEVASFLPLGTRSGHSFVGHIWSRTSVIEPDWFPVIRRPFVPFSWKTEWSLRRIEQKGNFALANWV